MNVKKLRYWKQGFVLYPIPQAKLKVPKTCFGKNFRTPQAKLETYKVRGFVPKPTSKACSFQESRWDFLNFPLGNKKAMIWPTLGKMILIVATLLLILVIISMVMGRSFGILDKIKGFLGG